MTVMTVLLVGSLAGCRDASPEIYNADIAFQEVSVKAGVEGRGPSFGASWGYFNQDSYLDLWVTHHQFKPSLFLNQGDGSFKDILDLVWEGNLRKDTHGASWGDFDGDGDQDLFETSGGLRGFMEDPDPKFGNNLYMNSRGRLVDRAPDLGVSYPSLRGRHGLWVDLDSDGFLDLTVSNIDFGSDAFLALRQTSAGFENVTEEYSMVTSRVSAFSSLADVTGDGALDLVVHAPAYPSAVFDLSGDRAEEILGSLRFPITKKTKDVVFGDFNGDLRTDVYVVRFDLHSSEWIQREPNHLQVHLFESIGEEVGISFQSAGDIRLKLEPAWKYGVTTDKIYIGEDGFHPEEVSFVLSAEDQRVHGIADHDRGGDMGVFVGFDTEGQRWQILHSKVSADDLEKLTGHIQSEGAISGVEPVNFDPSATDSPDRLLVQRESGFEDVTDEFGVGERNRCHTGVAADFDNDMDQDLYLVCTGVIGNSPNRLLENIGGERFVELEGAGGAEGSALGVGDSVAAADYDNDGFVDLFVMNGFGPTPFNDGPQELFRNRGNENHWLTLRLIGTISNRDAVGARVVVTTPDGKKQLREQGGGVHWKSQNDQRLHFGLGRNRSAERVEILWPSGLSQELENVAGDQILEVREGKAMEPSE